MSSIAMFGSGGAFQYPIINQRIPEWICDKPGVLDPRMELRQALIVTATFDHDSVDGAPAARVLQHLRELVEIADGLGDYAATEPKNR